MGHRKQSRPRHGSLAFLPRARARSLVARIRYWPEIEYEAPKLLAFAGYKVGMTQVSIIDNEEHSPTRGKEIVIPATIVETPPLLVIGARIYEKTIEGLRAKKDIIFSQLPEFIFRKLVTLKNRKEKKEVSISKGDLDENDEIRLIVSTQPIKAGIRKKTPEIFEVAISKRRSKEEIINYVNSVIGKEIRVTDVLNEGQFVDVFGITKGKGWAGVVKRYKVKLLGRKSNKTHRGIATLGAKSPNNVMFYVPRGGQMGVHQRYVRNLLVLKIGTSEKPINLKGGFLRYGILRSDFVLLKGSVPGPAKRLVKLRVSARKREKLAPPQITFISQASQQGV
ncbi:MAG: 50S ribosomal protein L3 [Candidatus Brockarchaeota archaeon]|nr:50S ribosomal protein L3 [Candidatus Brockarchaeota archaeon]MBO3767722.1 50S ribosomal protein L3 [Candidatus Brockarchaeota archaeon]MBO3801415.1 50S ribosomal protein L3 [Candidatus Brockarchaeota archaeon]